MLQDSEKISVCVATIRPKQFDFAGTEQVCNMATSKPVMTGRMRSLKFIPKCKTFKLFFVILVNWHFSGVIMTINNAGRYYRIKFRQASIHECSNEYLNATFFGHNLSQICTDCNAQWRGVDLQFWFLLKYEIQIIVFKIHSWVR